MRTLRISLVLIVATLAYLIGYTKGMDRGEIVTIQYHPYCKH